jgi:hypothetical protein
VASAGHKIFKVTNGPFFILVANGWNSHVIAFVIYLLQGLNWRIIDKEVFLGEMAYDNRGSRTQYFEIKVMYCEILMSKEFILSSSWLKLAM